MNKFLRFSLVALFCAMFNVTFADDIKFDFANDYATLFPGMGLSSSDSSAGDFTTTTTSTAVQGATVTVSPKTSGSSENRLWSGSLRLYSGTLTMTAPAGMEITQISFEVNSSKFHANNSVNVGTLENQTWTGQASEVVMTIAGNTQLKSLTMTVVAAGQDVPATITIDGTTPFYGSTQVTISINKATSDIYYTTDGSDPATSDAAVKYTAPFTIQETCTVKAFDDVSSASAEKTFEKAEIPTVEGAAAFLALPLNDIAIIKLTDAVVLGNGNNNTVIKDATGTLFIRYFGQDVKQGQKVNGTVMAKRDAYNGMDQANVAKDYEVNVTITDGTITPIETTAAEIASKPVFTEVYKLKEVEVKKNADNNRFYIMNGSEEAIQLYDEFKYANMIAAEGTYTIEGIRGFYGETAQFWVTKVGEEDDPKTDDVKKAANIAEFLALPVNTVAELTLTNAKVVHVFTTTNGNTSTYVRDNSGAVLFYNSAKDLAVNEDLNGTIIVVRNAYSNNAQATANDKTNLDNLLHTAGAAAEPKVITIAEAANNTNDLVKIENVTLTEDNNRVYAVSGADQIQVYNKFHVEAYEGDGLKNLVGTEAYTITGVVEAYNSTFEICPVDNGIVTGISEVSADNAANGVIYNIAGQRVNDSYKGIVIVNGKKMIKK